jgi:hypothetical protein
MIMRICVPFSTQDRGQDLRGFEMSRRSGAKVTSTKVPDGWAF